MKNLQGGKNVVWSGNLDCTKVIVRKKCNPTQPKFPQNFPTQNICRDFKYKLVFCVGLFNHQEVKVSFILCEMLTPSFKKKKIFLQSQIKLPENLNSVSTKHRYLTIHFMCTKIVCSSLSLNLISRSHRTLIRTWHSGQASSFIEYVLLYLSHK